MATKTAEMTPMRRQYFDIKERNQDCILFFRLGDFYEMFDEDARLAARELDLTLTTRDRNKPKEEQTPMCGVPYHSVDSYIARLVQKGYKVAICEQMTDPATTKGLVERDITRIITPGTVTESCMLEESKNNYLAASMSRAENSALPSVTFPPALFLPPSAPTLLLPHPSWDGFPLPRCCATAKVPTAN